MAYTLTQARPLLTAAELALFEQSRAEPIKGLTAAKLAGKIKRTRTLRDKYRDLYRRQTVALRGNARSARPGGPANERTQQKAEILQEVLDRYEARLALLQARAERDDARANAKRDAKASARDGGRARAAPQRGKTVVRQPRVAKPSARAGGRAGSAEAEASGGAGEPGGAAPPAQSSGAKQDAAKKSVSKKTTAGKAAAPAPTEASPPPGKAPARSSKAPSRLSPTADATTRAPHLDAPLDTVALAARASPLKQAPRNIARQAHQGARGRRMQGKRDSR